MSGEKYDYAQWDDWESRGCGTYYCSCCDKDYRNEFYRSQQKAIANSTGYWLCQTCYEREVLTKRETNPHQPTRYEGDLSELEPLKLWSDDLVGRRVVCLRSMVAIKRGNIYTLNGRYREENTGLHVGIHENENWEPPLARFALLPEEKAEPEIPGTHNCRCHTVVMEPEAFKMLKDVCREETTHSGTIVFEDGSEAVIPEPDVGEGWERYTPNNVQLNYTHLCRQKFQRIGDFTHFAGESVVREWSTRLEREGGRMFLIEWTRTITPEPVEPTMMDRARKRFPLLLGKVER